MPNMRNTSQQTAQCVNCMTKAHGGKSFQRICFAKYSITAPSWRKMNLCYQSYNEHGSRAHRAGNGRTTIGFEKQNQIKEIFEADPRRSLREVGALVGVYDTTTSHFSRRKLKLLPYRLRVGPQLLEIDKGILLRLLNYARRSCRRIQMSQNTFYL